MVTALLLTAAFGTAHAQSSVKSYGLTAAQNQSINVAVGKTDQGIIEMPCTVGNISLTLGNQLMASYQGNVVTVMPKTSNTRVPLVIYCENGSPFARVNIQGVATTGGSVYVKIVDDTPPPASARELGSAPAAPQRPAQVGAPLTAAFGSSAPAQAPSTLPASLPIVLPAPSSLALSAQQTDGGIELRVTNQTALPLNFSAEQLTLFVGSQSVTVPVGVGGAVAPGLSATFKVPYSGAAGDITATWNGYAEKIKTYFAVKAQ